MTRQEAIPGETVRGRRLPRLRLMVLAALGVAAVWLGAFGIARAYHFMQDDPSFCRTCHTMRVAWAQWKSGEHQGVTCHSCHETNLLGSLQQVWRYVTRHPDEVEARADVPAATCLGCHRPQEAAATPFSADMHHAASERAECFLCHGQELHHFQTPSWGGICASCH
jgi:hypothetical protein